MTPSRLFSVAFRRFSRLDDLRSLRNLSAECQALMTRPLHSHFNHPELVKWGGGRRRGSRTTWTASISSAPGGDTLGRSPASGGFAIKSCFVHSHVQHPSRCEIHLCFELDRSWPDPISSYHLVIQIFFLVSKQRMDLSHRNNWIAGRRAFKFFFSNLDGVLLWTRSVTLALAVHKPSQNVHFVALAPRPGCCSSCLASDAGSDHVDSESFLFRIRVGGFLTKVQNRRWTRLVFHLSCGIVPTEMGGGRSSCVSLFAVQFVIELLHTK
jgi:hypothetical protein